MCIGCAYSSSSQSFVPCFQFSEWINYSHLSKISVFINNLSEISRRQQTIGDGPLFLILLSASLIEVKFSLLILINNIKTFIIYFTTFDSWNREEYHLHVDSSAIDESQKRKNDHDFFWTQEVRDSIIVNGRGTINLGLVTTTTPPFDSK